MLYVFHVDTGTMMTFDINLALESVESLKQMIEKMCKIPASSQVLLVSGGEVLRSDARVCKYSAGTDTNPIYMFSKTFTPYEPVVSIGDYSTDVDLKEQVENCMKMPANYRTVVTCSQLAQQFWELAREHTHICEKLVHDQHLQQQGWAAVVANMDDVTCDFNERAEDFERKFKEYLNKKDEYAEFLSRFNEDLEVLSNIPILPALRLNAASNPFTAFDELQGDSESYSDKQNEDNIESDKSNLIIDSDKRNLDVTIIQTDNQGTIGSNDGSSKTSSLQGASGSTASEGDEGIESSREGQDSSTQLSSKNKSKSNTKEAVTLLHWITAKENQESLKDIAKYCNKALELFNSSVMTTLRTEVAEALASACHEDMKRIKGLEERLCGLEQLMREARRIEQEQKDLAHSFMQNQQKAVNLGDISVLRVLCESHCQQLQSMSKNDQRLRDIRGRCARAKEELAINLDHRLKWIVYVENKMFETDSRLMFYHRSLSRLKRHLAIIGQLHRAPKLFCTAVHEIVRRRTFSQTFLSWASELASHLLTIHSEEVTRRKDFHNLFSGHFLSGLFPGTEDIPPPFGTQSPRLFDCDLPKLTQSDIDTLTGRMPQLTPELDPCDMTPVINFFQSRSANDEKNLDRMPVDERLTALRETGLDRGFESETDTEEFEKVGQSPLDRRILGPSGNVCSIAAKTDATTLTEVRSPLHQTPINSSKICHIICLAPIPEISPFKNPNENNCLFSPSSSSPSHSSPRPPSPTSPTAAPGHRADFEPAEFYIEESPPTSIEWGFSRSPMDSQTFVSLLQDNIGSERSEMGNLKEIISSLNNICSQSITIIRNELGNIKSDTVNNNNDFKTQCQSILTAWDKYISENSLRERETLQRLTVDHELEMNDVKEILSNKEEQIRTLNLDIKQSDNKLLKLMDDMNSKISHLEQTILNYEKTENEYLKKIDEIKLANEKAIKDLQTKMAQEHKAEVESLRSRFRFVSITSMDRSPSESSLEKIERPDMIEISSHKAIISQTKEDMEFEKEEAIKLALEKQEKEWKAKLEEFEKSKSDIPLNDAVKRIIEEKERQLELSRERENNLYRECLKYKETIQQLSDPETTDYTSSTFLQVQVTTLLEENKALKEQLKQMGVPSASEKVIKEQQTELVQLKDSSTSPDPKYRLKIWKLLMPHGIVPGTFTTVSCEPGDTVVIVWDEKCSNYCILQESSSQFLVHTDSLVALKLEPGKIPYAVGVVINKDHCIAVKYPNRYNVPIGVNFYQVKLKPKSSRKIACDNSSKYKESSQKKDVVDMSGSVIVSSSSGLAKSHGKEPMSKSVWTVLSDSQTPNTTTSVFERLVTKKVDESVAVQESTSRQDNLDSIIFSIADTSTTEEEKIKSPIPHIAESAANTKEPNITVQSTQPEESVPYPISNDECVSGNMSTEQFVSEIAEEAAP